MPAALAEAFAPVRSAPVGLGDADFEQFERLVRRPGPIQRWLESVPLGEVVADSLPVACEASCEASDCHGEFEDSQLRWLCQLDQDIVTACLDAALPVIKANVLDAWQKMKTSYAVLAEVAAFHRESKFEAVQMSRTTGKINDFHNGLTQRIGTPNIDYAVTMKAEHCSKAGCTTEFTTSNYQIATTPQLEWSYVVDGLPCPDDQLRKEHMPTRRIPNINILMESPRVKKAGLCREEVIAIVLYTGPMYMIYNSVLRQWPPHIYDPLVAGNNLYSATIFVLNSAVLKLGQHASIPEGLMLYRGFSGVDLPESFLNLDENGCRGFTEWGFMSTTTVKSMAVQYSGGARRQPQAFVLAIRPNSVDRGAPIAEFSQYEDEAEYLWPPCAFVHGSIAPLVESWDEGVVTILPVIVSVQRGETSTVEGLLNKKKNLHVAAFRFGLDELTQELDKAAAAPEALARLADDTSVPKVTSLRPFLDKINELCRKVCEEHECREAAQYVNNLAHRKLVCEMLNTLQWGREGFRRWLEDSTVRICNIAHQLNGYHRRYLVHLRREIATATLAGESERLKQASLQLLQSKGLLDNVEERQFGEGVASRAGAEGWYTDEITALLAIIGTDDAATLSGAVAKAAENGNAETLSALLAAGAPHTRGLYGACFAGQMSCVKALLAAGADVNHGSGSISPLFIAAQNGHAAIIEVLLEARADPNTRMDDGASAVFMAAQNGHAEALRVLIKAGADVNRPMNDGCNPVFIASQNNKPATLALLLEGGADHSIKFRGCSAISRARAKGNTGCVDLLVAAGASD